MVPPAFDGNPPTVSPLSSYPFHPHQPRLLASGSAVVRRFEFYKYSGAVNAIAGEAMCADVLCNAPAAGELGGFIGAQNAAANLNVPLHDPVTVTVAGSGLVDSSDRRMQRYLADLHGDDECGHYIDGELP